MESFFYTAGNGGVSGWRTFATLHSLYGRARLKRQQLEIFLRQHRIDVAVTDSEYVTAPLRRRGIPVIGLNNSDVIVSEYLKLKHVPPEIRSHFWFVEFSDYLFHRFFCDTVISPSALPGLGRHPKIKRVGLIVRQEVLEARPTSLPSVVPAQLKTVVFLLSGSIFASKINFGNGQLPFNAEVIGRDGENIGNVIYHGRKLDPLPILAKADALVINGGFSAVSEAIALGKPTFVIPVPGHAEQHINALAVAKLGCGYMVSENEVIDRLIKVHSTNQWEGLGLRPPITNVNGAREAADIIAGLVMQKRLQSAKGVRP